MESTWRGRIEQAASGSVIRAFALSLSFHFLLFVTIELGQKVGLWKISLLSEVLPKNPARQLSRNQPPPQREVPVVFIEVDPAQATPDPPPEAKFYSSQNSRATNPDPKIETGTPKISGSQEKVARTIDRPRSQPAPLQPAPAPPPPEVKEPEPAQPTPEPTPPAGETPGELAMAKPSLRPDLTPNPRPIEPIEKELPKPRQRPRRIAEALRQQPNAGLVGEKMKQDGGVRRFSIAEGLDVKATPFGSYDAAIIAAIQQRWFDLLDQRDFSRNHSGKVVLTFRLNSDGRITDLRITENEVNDILALLCQRAVQDPAPYQPWPSDMRRLIGADYREVRFTFHYN